MPLRRALLYSSIERYATLMLSFISIAALSRLLTPQEIGVSVIGATIYAFAELMRDIPSSYLVQQPNLTRDDTRTAFTSMFLISIVLGVALIFAAPWIASAYNDPGISTYLRIIAFIILITTIERPLMALFRREMAFGTYAIVNVTAVFINLASTLCFVLLGYSYTSFALGTLAGALTTNILALYFKPEFWIFRPSISQWRTAARFGSSTILFGTLNKIAEMVPYLILSRMFSLDIVGYYNRMTIMNSLPDKLIFSGIGPVIFPAFAEHHRAGHDLKAPFLLGAAYITAAAWPAFILLVIFAYPAVRILLGPQWISVVPLVQTSAIAFVFAYPAYLVSSTLLAIGALRSLVMTALIGLPFTIAITAFAATRGLEALALSLLVTVPIQAMVNFLILRWHLKISWAELLQAVKPSALITITATAIPLLGVAARGFDFKLPIWEAFVLALGALAGWLTGLWLTQHPLKNEVLKVYSAARDRLLSCVPS